MESQTNGANDVSADFSNVTGDWLIDRLSDFRRALTLRYHNIGVKHRYGSYEMTKLAQLYTVLLNEENNIRATLGYNQFKKVPIWVVNELGQLNQQS